MFTETSASCVVSREAFRGSCCSSMLGLGGPTERGGSEEGQNKCRISVPDLLAVVLRPALHLLVRPRAAVIRPRPAMRLSPAMPQLRLDTPRGVPARRRRASRTCR